MRSRHPRRSVQRLDRPYVAMWPLQPASRRSRICFFQSAGQLGIGVLLRPVDLPLPVPAAEGAVLTNTAWSPLPQNAGSSG